jgi:hypothetical protein
LGAYFGVAHRQPPKVPKQRQCPNINCQELNTPEAPFCTKCRIPLTVSGHVEREQEFKALKERMDQMGQVIMKLESSMKCYMDEHSWYVSKFGLSEPYRKKIEGFREQMRALPDDDIDFG